MRTPWVPSLGLVVGLSGTLFGGETCIYPVSPHPIEVVRPDGRHLRVRALGGPSRLRFVDALGRSVAGMEGLPSPLEPEFAGSGVGLHPKLSPHAGDVPGGFQPRSSTTGTLKNLTILVRFSDHGPGGQDRTLPSAADFDTIMNAVGGDGVLAPTGSVRDHYLENSYGLLSLESTVVGWIDLPNSETYYANSNSGLTSVTWELIEDALDLVDPLVDFGDFDQDADGAIDSITFIHSGYAAEWIATDSYGTAYADRMWSHRWTIPTWTAAEGVTVTDYHISPGLWDVTGSAPGRIGVICHETGHFLGLPDLYDTSGGGQGLGNWCLMAAGSWGFDDSQQNPSHLSAWCKQHLGWLTPETISPAFSVIHTLDNLEDFPAAMRIDSGYPTGEYLLLENRQQTGFDALVPEDGLLIYHIDEAKGTLSFNDVNADEGYPLQPGWPANNKHYRVALLAADGAYDLEQGFNRGDAGDVYHDAGVDEIHETTVPDTNRYQAGIIAVNENRVHSIQDVGDQVKFCFESPLAPIIAHGPLPIAVVGKAYSLKLSARNGTAPVVFDAVDSQATYSEVDRGIQSFQTTGVAQGWQADDAIFPLPLPFEFPFFGANESTVYVSTNGFLDFAPVDSDPFPDADSLRFARRIAPLWEDLITHGGPGQDIYIDTSVTGEITIRWQGERYVTADPVNFSVTLQQDGTIAMHYGGGNTQVAATVGISAGRDFRFRIGGYDQRPSLTDADTVVFLPSATRMPPGIRLSRDGILSGTATQSGSFWFEVQATDAEGREDVEIVPLDVLSTAPSDNRLMAYPESASIGGDTVTLHNCGGAPGHLALAFIVAVSGQPFYRLIASGPFDTDGQFALHGPVPADPGLQGQVITFATFEVGSGSIQQSNPAEIEFY